MKFKEYKGLNLPNIADEVLKSWDSDNTFDKSITTREENQHSYFMKAHHQQMVYLVSTRNGSHD